jgi:predicted naringenin-chalcone synthase
MAERSGIHHRYSVLAPDPGDGRLDRDGFYRRGRFPDTAARMAVFRREAFGLARAAVEGLDIARDRARITHLVLTCCTGFYAPGPDVEIVRHFGLDPGVERTLVGFMGCHAAVNGLRLARHVVRSTPEAAVLLVNLELCTLRLQESPDLEEVLSFLIFADGCAASLVTADPAGIRLDGFTTTVLPGTEGLITWTIGAEGFDMHLSGRVPAMLGSALPGHADAILGGLAPHEVAHWAVHPGGRSILDAIGQGFGLPPAALGPSREVLAGYGNMSSATLMFVLARILARARNGGPGVAIAFGPGLTAEAMHFTLEARR